MGGLDVEMEVVRGDILVLKKGQNNVNNEQKAIEFM
jgi:hypothetical protein